MPRKPASDTSTRPIFSNRDELFDDSLQKELEAQKSHPVECLGITFANDAARRKYFLDKLREKLKDPQFRKIEGFPIGKDEDILALSDPPYYTACPNPFIADFIKHYGKPYDPKVSYRREPFAADVSEGKNDPIYNAHSYHTKVPHKAIMRYVLHYTEPGDLVFDGFCGTGMTGVAAQMCGDKAVVESLGYVVDKNGTISQQDTEETGKTAWKQFAKLGARRAVLIDLSPAATFIANNYNTPVNVDAFESEARRILAAVEEECGWMYETLHTDGKTKGSINYTVWSDVFVCPECTREVVFWDAAVDTKAGSVREEFPCPHCKATLTKRNMERAWVTQYDSAIKQNVRQTKQAPVLINYTAGGRRAEKAPDKHDLALLKKLAEQEIPHWYPTDRMMDGKETRRNDPFGITHAHHFYTKRNLWVLASLRAALRSSPMADQLLCLVGDQLPRASKMHKIAVSRLNTNLSKTAGVLAGTLYVPSNQIEYSVLEMISFRIDDIASYLRKRDRTTRHIVLTSSTERTLLPDNSIDYVFIDPPFGSNLYYSELNYLWEAWLKVVTNNIPEAIENSVQNKGMDEYRHLMTSCFREVYRVLKPGRWMTVEFSNTKASVWNGIQTSLTEAGFIVANVSALDKQQGSFKAVTTPTAVKQDLVITAYKPNGGFEDRFKKEAATEDGVWDFVRTHLGYLPVVKRAGKAAQIVTVAERDPRILFDRMVAYYVKSGIPVPVSSGEFQQGLAERFAERDGMYFLPEQAAEYDRRRALAEEMAEQVLFVSDEASAIQWLRQVLKEKPQIFSDVNGQFMQQLGGWSKHEQQLDLRVLLDQNFLVYDGNGPVPEQIHAYLSSNWKELRNLPKNDPKLREKAKNRWYVPDPNKAGDLEKLREKALLKEFEEYRAEKRLRVFRTEAVRVGFKAAYDRQDYKTIVAVAAKLPESVLEEDEKLLMYHDVATMRLGDSDKDKLFQ